MKRSRILMLVGILVLCIAPLAEAKRYSVNKPCAQAFNPQGNTEELQGAAMLFYWVPGWWAAMHNDPYINDWRRSLLTEAIVEACRSNENTRILDAVRKVKSLPKVPDNALKLSCDAFLTSGYEWQVMNVFWLQGYYAYKDGHDYMETDPGVVFNKLEAICKKNRDMPVAQAARKVLNY